MSKRDLKEELENAVLTFLDYWIQLDHRGMDAIATIMKLPDSITFEFKYCMQDFVYQYEADYPENNLSLNCKFVPKILYPSKTDQEIIEEFPKVVNTLADLFSEMECDLYSPVAALMRLPRTIIDDLAYFMSKYEAVF